MTNGKYWVQVDGNPDDEEMQEVIDEVRDVLGEDNAIVTGKDIRIKEL